MTIPLNDRLQLILPFALDLKKREIYLTYKLLNYSIFSLNLTGYCYEIIEKQYENK